MSCIAAHDADEWLLAAVDTAGYGSEEALVVAVSTSAGQIHHSRGRSAAGAAITVDTVVYTASLSKQVTAACAAALAVRSVFDVQDRLRRWLPELPAWADGVSVVDLIHHTSGLPEVLDFAELQESGRGRTSEGVLRALTDVEHPLEAPGTVHRYCNAGYVALGAVVERVTGQQLADFAAQRVFTPLRMRSSRYWSGPGPHPPGAAPTEVGMPAALSLGDGGVWSTARDLLRWNAALEGDELGISSAVSAPGRLRDGTFLDYAWGVGIRAHGGARVYRHGGSWAGLSAQLVRVPGRGGAVVLALDDDDDRTAALADVLIARLLA